MPVLQWDQTGQRFYETGVSKGVLYIPTSAGVYDKGYAWNGLTAVTESPSGAEPTPMWADNIKYLNILSREDFMATVEAMTYPNEFAQCDGTAQPKKGVNVGQQARKIFGMSYRTQLGNDVLAQDFSYKIHLIYGAKAAPSEKAYATINDSPEAVPFSWELSTTEVDVPNLKPTAIITIDASQVLASELKSFEDILYGTATNTARLPLPTEVLTLFTTAVTA